MVPALHGLPHELVCGLSAFVRAEDQPVERGSEYHWQHVPERKTNHGGRRQSAPSGKCELGGVGGEAVGDLQHTRRNPESGGSNSGRTRVSKSASLTAVSPSRSLVASIATEPVNEGLGQGLAPSPCVDNLCGNEWIMLQRSPRGACEQGNVPQLKGNDGSHGQLAQRADLGHVCASPPTRRSPSPRLRHPGGRKGWCARQWCRWR